MKRIFLTGGTGFFGKWLLKRIQGLGTEVVILSRNPERFCCEYSSLVNQCDVSFVKGDVRDFNYPTDKFDYVIHAATEASVKFDQKTQDDMYSVIVDGTKRVLDFSRQAGVQRILYVSSGAVYGVQPPELSHIPETFPCNPVTAYGKGKLRAEQMCLESGTDAVIARCFAFVGPWIPLDSHFAIGNFIGNCLRNEPIEIQGDGSPFRSYMYGLDLADWLMNILLNGCSGGVYNVGSDEAISISDLAFKVRACAGTESSIMIQGRPNKSGFPSRYVPSISKAKEELGVCFQFTLDAAIRQTLCWHRDQSCKSPERVKVL